MAIRRKCGPIHSRITDGGAHQTALRNSSPMPYAARRLWTWRPSRPEFTAWSIPPRRARQSIYPCRPAGQPHNCRDANAAPWASASNSAHMMVGCTQGLNAPCENPQSVPAITFFPPSRKACRSDSQERQAIVDAADLLLQDVERGGTGDDADDDANADADGGVSLKDGVSKDR